MAKIKSAVLCSLLCVCILLVGCGSKYKQITPSDEDLTVVGTIGDKQIYLDELRYAVQVCKSELISAYGEDIFEGADAQKYREMLKEGVIDGICANYATVFLCEEAMISLGEDAVISRVDQKMQLLVDELGGMSEYKKYLRDNGLTDRLVRFTTELSLLQSELMYVYIDDIARIEDDDDKVFDIIEDEFIAVRHIFIPHSEGDTMQKAVKALESGSDFSSLIVQYNRDGEMSTGGQFILRGYMSDEYEAVAFSLAEGERSGVVSDAKGLYIIERAPMTTSDIMMNFDYLKELYQTYAFYAIVDQRQAELELIFNAAGEEYLNGIWS